MKKKSCICTQGIELSTLRSWIKHKKGIGSRDVKNCRVLLGIGLRTPRD